MTLRTPAISRRIPTNSALPAPRIGSPFVRLAKAGYGPVRRRSRHSSSLVGAASSCAARWAAPRTRLVVVLDRHRPFGGVGAAIDLDAVEPGAGIEHMRLGVALAEVEPADAFAGLQIPCLRTRSQAGEQEQADARVTHVVAHSPAVAADADGDRLAAVYSAEARERAPARCLGDSQRNRRAAGDGGGGCGSLSEHEIRSRSRSGNERDRVRQTRA